MHCRNAGSRRGPINTVISRSPRNSYKKMEKLFLKFIFLVPGTVKKKRTRPTKPKCVIECCCTYLSMVYTLEHLLNATVNLCPLFIYFFFYIFFCLFLLPNWKRRSHDQSWDAVPNYFATLEISSENVDERHSLQLVAWKNFQGSKENAKVLLIPRVFHFT